MTLRFIHSADWHIGKPFGSFPTDVAGELTAARMAVIPRIAAHARTHGAADVLVAGDVFDSEKLPDVDVRRTIERLASELDVTWHLLPGNHDPHRDNGLWARLLRSGLPKNVSVHLTAEPVAFGTDGVLLPTPLTRKAPGTDPTLPMNDIATPAGLKRIGFAHGPVQAFGGDVGSSAPISVDRVVSARLAYLALGDWHGMREVAPRCWYSGTPEPDRYTDNNPGNVLLVDVAGETHISVEPLRTATFTWRDAMARVQSEDDFEPLALRLSAGASDTHAMVVKCRMSGTLPVGTSDILRQWVETWRAKFRYFDVDSSDVIWRASADDLDRLSADPALHEAAKRLDALARATDTADAAVAALALRRLFDFAAEAVVEPRP